MLLSVGPIFPLPRRVFLFNTVVGSPRIDLLLNADSTSPYSPADLDQLLGRMEQMKRNSLCLLSIEVIMTHADMPVLMSREDNRPYVLTAVGTYISFTIAFLNNLTSSSGFLMFRLGKINRYNPFEVSSSDA